MSKDVKFHLYFPLFLLTLSCLIAISYSQQKDRENRQNWRFAFDQPQTVWHLETAPDSTLKAAEHRYVPEEGYGGRGCEFISLNIPAEKESVMIGMKVGTGILTDDVLPSLYVKSNRTGLRFLLRVILPFTRTPKNEAISVMLEGTTYSSNGRWQQLRIDRPLDQLKKQSREIAFQTGKELDLKYAFFDMAFLDINGGEGQTSVWIDDVEITAFEPIDATQALIQAQNMIDALKSRGQSGGTPPKTPSVDISLSPAQPGGVSNGAPNNYNNPINNPSGNYSQPDSQNSAPRRTPEITVSGESILINQSPFFLRAIRHQGEPLQFLRDLGFNALWLDSIPSDPLMAEAEALGIWLICPPPLSETQADVVSENAELNFVPSNWGDKFYRVIGWNLGDLSKAGYTVEQVGALSRRIRECDRESGRPIFAMARSELRNISRFVDALAISRNPMYSSLDIKSHLRWLRDVPCLLRPGVPRCCLIPTQPSEELSQQWRAMFPHETYPASISYEQLLLQTFAAAGSGNRVLIFDSYSPLNQADADSQYRAKCLELINAKLTINDSFFAAGMKPTPIETSDKNLWYLMLTIPGKGRLMLPLFIPENAQYVLAGRLDRPVHVVVPGIPVTYQAYRLTPNGLEPLVSSRQTGGTRITVDSQADSSMILLTRDPTVVSSLFNRLQNYGRNASVLLRDITLNRLENFKPWMNPAKASKNEMDLFNQAVGALYRSDVSLKQNLWAESDKACAKASNALRILEYSYWQRVVGTIREPIFHPAAVSFRSMRFFHLWRQDLAQYKLGDNILPAGDFETFESFRDSQWKLFVDKNGYEPMKVNALISPGAAFSGKNGLKLAASLPIEYQNEIALMERPPVAIYSPVITVNPHETVKITCMVLLPEPLKCTVDGLIIRDVYSGVPLARKMVKTLGWQPVVLFRTADSEGKIQLVFELSGLGEAYIDDARVYRIVPRMNSEQSDVDQ